MYRRFNLSGYFVIAAVNQSLVTYRTSFLAHPLSGLPATVEQFSRKWWHNHPLLRSSHHNHLTIFSSDFLWTKQQYFPALNRTMLVRYRIIYFYYLFFHRRPTHKLCFLSYRPFVVNTTFSTGLVDSSVSWLGQLTVGVQITDYFNCWVLHN